MTKPGRPSVELDHIVTKFPDHRTLGKALQDGVNDTMAQLRAARGKVVAPEDTYETVRWAQGIAESFHEYGRAFAGAAALVGQYAEEELTEAVGEQDGIPTQSLTVPDVDGSDIQLAKQTSNTHHIDKGAVLRALAVSFVQQHDVTGELSVILSDLYDRVEWTDKGTEEATYERAEEKAVEFLLQAFEELAELGTFSLQVTKVAAFSKELARRDTLLASTVTGAMGKTTEYSGVKMSRTFPKSNKSKEKPSG
jgi:hypothetical protein